MCDTRKWSVGYAYRDKDGEYHESDLIVDMKDASSIDLALQVADYSLGDKGEDERWRTFFIYSIGVIADADDEVC